MPKKDIEKTIPINQHFKEKRIPASYREKAEAIFRDALVIEDPNVIQNMAEKIVKVSTNSPEKNDNLRAGKWIGSMMRASKKKARKNGFDSRSQTPAPEPSPVASGDAAKIGGKYIQVEDTESEEEEIPASPVASSSPLLSTPRKRQLPVEEELIRIPAERYASAKKYKREPIDEVIDFFARQYKKKKKRD